MNVKEKKQFCLFSQFYNFYLWINRLRVYICDGLRTSGAGMSESLETEAWRDSACWCGHPDKYCLSLCAPVQNNQENKTCNQWHGLCKTSVKNIGSFLSFEMGLRWSNACATQRTDVSMRKPECHSAEVVFSVGQHRCCAVSFSRNQV